MNGEMKPYETPKAEVLALSEEDVVKTSNETPIIPIG